MSSNVKNTRKGAGGNPTNKQGSKSKVQEEINIVTEDELLKKDRINPDDVLKLNKATKGSVKI